MADETRRDKMRRIADLTIERALSRIESGQPATATAAPQSFGGIATTQPATITAPAPTAIEANAANPFANSLDDLFARADRIKASTVNPAAVGSQMASDPARFFPIMPDESAATSAFGLGASRPLLPPIQIPPSLEQPTIAAPIQTPRVEPSAQLGALSPVFYDYAQGTDGRASVIPRTGIPQEDQQVAADRNRLNRLLDIAQQDPAKRRDVLRMLVADIGEDAALELIRERQLTAAAQRGSPSAVQAMTGSTERPIPPEDLPGPVAATIIQGTAPALRMTAGPAARAANLVLGENAPGIVKSVAEDLPKLEQLVEETPSRSTLEGIARLGAGVGGEIGAFFIPGLGLVHPGVAGAKFLGRAAKPATDAIGRAATSAAGRVVGPGGAKLIGKGVEGAAHLTASLPGFVAPEAALSVAEGLQSPKSALTETILAGPEFLGTAAAENLPGAVKDAVQYFADGFESTHLDSLRRNLTPLALLALPVAEAKHRKHQIKQNLVKAAREGGPEGMVRYLQSLPPEVQETMRKFGADFLSKHANELSSPTEVLRSTLPAERQAPPERSSLVGERVVTTGREGQPVEGTFIGFVKGPRIGAGEQRERFAVVETEEGRRLVPQDAEIRPEQPKNTATAPPRATTAEQAREAQQRARLTPSADAVQLRARLESGKAEQDAAPPAIEIPRPTLTQRIAADAEARRSQIETQRAEAEAGAEENRVRPLIEREQADPTGKGVEGMIDAVPLKDRHVVHKLKNMRPQEDGYRERQLKPGTVTGPAERYFRDLGFDVTVEQRPDGPFMRVSASPVNPARRTRRDVGGAETQSVKPTIPTAEQAPPTSRETPKPTAEADDLRGRMAKLDAAIKATSVPIAREALQTQRDALAQRLDQITPKPTAEDTSARLKGLRSRLAALRDPAVRPMLEQLARSPKDLDREQRSIEQEIARLENEPTERGIVRRINKFKGTGGISSEAKGAGFKAAFRDSETGEVFEMEGIHSYDKLPDRYVVNREEGSGIALEVTPNIVDGFVRDGKFYTRDEAARAVKNEGFEVKKPFEPAQKGPDKDPPDGGAKVEEPPTGPLPAEPGGEGPAEVDRLTTTKWIRGVNKLNAGSGDKFYSASEDVAGDFAINKPGDKPKLEQLAESDRPKNPLHVTDKSELAELIGYDGDPLVERFDAKVKFDNEAKRYAQSKGHDGILYENGTLGEPELHVFEKSPSGALPGLSDAAAREAHIDTLARRLTDAHDFPERSRELSGVYGNAIASTLRAADRMAKRYDPKHPNLVEELADDLTKHLWTQLPTKDELAKLKSPVELTSETEERVGEESRRIAETIAGEYARREAADVAPPAGEKSSQEKVSEEPRQKADVGKQETERQGQAVDAVEPVHEGGPEAEVASAREGGARPSDKPQSKKAAPPEIEKNKKKSKPSGPVIQSIESPGVKARRIREQHGGKWVNFKNPVVSDVKLAKVLPEEGTGRNESLVYIEDQKGNLYGISGAIFDRELVREPSEPHKSREPQVVIEEAEVRPYRRPDGSIGYEAIPKEPKATESPKPVAGESPKQPLATKVGETAPPESARTKDLLDRIRKLEARQKGGGKEAGLPDPEQLDELTSLYRELGQEVVKLTRGGDIRPEDAETVGVVYKQRIDGKLSQADFDKFLDEMVSSATIKVDGGPSGVSAADRKSDQQRTDPPRSADQGNLGEKPSAVRRVPEKDRGVSKDAPTDAGGSSGVRGKGVEGGADAEGGPRDGDGGIRQPPRRGRDADRPGSGNARGRNYRIGESDSIGAGGIKTKFKQNLDAIRLLKKIESEGRLATPEEQAKLVKYVGFGGMPQAFETYSDKFDSKALKDLLTPEEYEAARRSTINAHYTSEPVIRGIWDGLSRMGFAGGSVVEPAAGIGHFIGLMPESISSNSRVTAIELDPLTARIAKQLYQAADVRNQGFQDVLMGDGRHDLFVSNVPFADVRITDSLDRDLSRIGAPLHDYFFAKAIKKVRDGGLVAFITSRYSLDKKNSRFRQAFQNLGADLVGAVRLPYTAFKSNANTEVVTDILVFQKRAQGAAPGGEPFLTSVETKVGKNTFSVNEYFEKHPEDILGKPAATGTMRAAEEYNVEPIAGQDLGKAIAERMAAFKDRVNLEALDQTARKTSEMRDVEYSTPTDLPEGSLSVKGGRAYRVREGNLVPIEPFGIAKRTFIDRVRGQAEIRDATNDLLRKQISADTPEAEVQEARARLNDLYDRFVSKHGFLNSRSNVSVFTDDPGAFRLRSLENWDAELETATKSDLFSRRTQWPRRQIEPTDDVSKALPLSLAERGRVDLDWMSNLTGSTREEVLRDLGDLVYETPQGSIELASRYLSGNVREKLREAEAAAKLDRRFEKNVEALKKVQPADVGPGQIKVKPGAVWITPEMYQEFARQVLEMPGASFKYVPSEGTWVVAKRGSDSGVSLSQWGTVDIPGLNLLEKVMNHREIVVREKTRDGYVLKPEETALAQSRAEALKARFNSWLWEDFDRSKQLVRTYNDRFNNFVPEQFDGSHLTLPGMSEVKKPRAYQLDGVWRMVSGGNTLLDWVVGAGKTLTLAAGVMERRRLGVAKKQVIVAPNHIVESGQWANEFLQLYPGAKILAATTTDFSPEKRQTLMNKIATGDWDAIIVPETSFEKVQMSPRRVKAFFDAEIAELENAIREAKAERGDNRSFVKELEKAKARLEEKLEALSAGWKKDPGPYFDELGIDTLVVDEAHDFKNLWFRTKMSRIPGVNPAFTQRSFDLFLKSQHINEITNGNGVFFASGTPVTNSIAEVYTLQRYLQPGVLRDAGIESFDAWAANFGDTKTQAEISPEGRGIRMHTRFSRFNNVAELLRMFRKVSDRKTADDINIARPKIRGGKPQTIVSEATPIVKSMVDALVERAERMRRTKVDPSVDNMLKVTTEGRKVALDPRLIDPSLPDDPNSKVNQAVQRVHEIWERTRADRGTQVIWAEFGVPPKEGGRFNLYQDIKNKLVARGIPESEVAFVQDATSQAERNSMFTKMRRGDIRVLIANSKRLGTGSNIQDRLAAAHHLDPTWTPADIEQRDGRIQRFGNLYDEVDIYRYVTKGTFDAYMWQTLENKAIFLNQFLNGKLDVREMEDVGDVAMSYAEMKAAAAENPRLMDFVRIDHEVKTLQSEKAGFDSDRYRAQSHAEYLKAQADSYEKSGKSNIKDAEAFEKVAPAEGDKMVMQDVSGRDLTASAEINPYILKQLDGLDPDGSWSSIGKLYGFDVQAHKTKSWDDKFRYFVTLNGARRHEIELDNSPIANNAVRLINKLRGLKASGEENIRHAEQLRTEANKTLESFRGDWPKAQRLEEALRERSALQNELMAKPGDKKETDPTETEGEGGGEVAGFPGDVELGAPGKSRAIPPAAVTPRQIIRKMMDQTLANQGKEPPISRETIRRRIEKDFDTRIGVGWSRMLRRWALGWFRPRDVKIRLRNADDISTIIHEIGHQIDYQAFGDSVTKFGGLANAAGREAVKEAVAMGKALYGSRKPNIGGYRAEGVAEYLVWRTQTNEAAKHAPHLHAFFEKWLEKNQDYRAKLDNIAAMSKQFIEQGAEARARSQISFSTEREPLDLRRRFDRAIELTAEPFKMLRRIEEAAEENLGHKLAPAKSPYRVARAFQKTAAGVVHEWVFRRVTDATGQKTRGASLMDALTPLAGNKKRIQDLELFAAAMHARDIHNQGKQSGFDRKDVDFIIKKFSADPAMKQARQNLVDWGRNVLEYAVDAGLIDGTTVSRLRKKYPNYVPFFRKFDAREFPSISQFTPTGGKRIVDPSNVVKRLKGSTRRIKSPIENLVSQAHEIASAAQKQLVLNALVGLNAVPGMGNWISPVDPKTRTTRFTLEEIQKQLEAKGIEIPEEVDLMTPLAIFREDFSASRDKDTSNIIRFRKPDGSFALYDVHPDLFRTLKGMDALQLPPFINVLTMPTRGVRAGATLLNPAFGLVRNPSADIGTREFQSRHGGYVFGPVQSAKGILEEAARKFGFGDSEGARMFAALGQEVGVTPAGLDRAAFRKTFKTLQKKLRRGNTTYHLMSPVESLRELNAIPEAGVRIGEFEKALAYARTKWPNDPLSQSVYAANAASSATVDFRNYGRLLEWMNAFVPFIGARVSGYNEMKNAIRQVPARVAIAGAKTLAATYALWLMNHDEEWYKNLSDIEKAMYWHIPTGTKEDDGSDRVIRIKRPHEWGWLFAAIPEAAFNSFLKDGPKNAGALTRMLKEAFYASSPVDIGSAEKGLSGKDVISNIALARPWVEIAANESWFGTPIIPENRLNKLPKSQYNERTTELAKMIGEMFDMSPAKVEHVVAGYTGGLPVRAVESAEQILNIGEKNQKKNEGKGLLARLRGSSFKDIPILGTLFTRTSGVDVNARSDFYRRLRAAEAMEGSVKLGDERDISKRGFVENALDLRRLREQKKVIDRVMEVRERANARMTRRLNIVLSHLYRGDDLETAIKKAKEQLEAENSRRIAQ